MTEDAEPAWRLVSGPAASPRPEAWTRIPRPLLAAAPNVRPPLPDDGGVRAAAGDGYDADEDLIEAANAAISLGQPLLLTGEPGSGKTSFADHVAWQLGLPPALRFQIRGDMSARELFYRYDDLARFRAAQEWREGESFAPESFLHLSALGKAIVLAADPARFASLRAKLAPAGPEWRVRRVVLIDEIDKAPRDVPNDLLGFLTAERLWFDVPELSRRGEIVEIEADPAFQPIIIFTSNSERSLPEAFLRRCLFHEIAFPEGERLRKIIARRAGPYDPECKLMKSLAKEVEEVRNKCPPDAKKPGVAEVLSLALALKADGYMADHDLATSKAAWRGLARVTLLKQVKAQDALYPRPDKADPPE
jgi:MoxR-like ATPase